MSRRVWSFLVPAALMVCLAAGALLAVEVEVEYDRQIDFSKYKTYTWRQKPDTGKPETDARVLEALDGQLKEKGWTRIEQGEADAVLAAHAIVKEDQQVDTAYTGWGSGWNWSGPGPLAGVATTVRTDLRVGTLVLDVFDAGSKKLVWRGTAKDTLAPDQETNRRKLQQAVTRLFKGFPPAPAASQKSGP